MAGSQSSRKGVGATKEELGVSWDCFDVSGVEVGKKIRKNDAFTCMWWYHMSLSPVGPLPKNWPMVFLRLEDSFQFCLDKKHKEISKN